MTYSGHRDKIRDAICIENSHGVATCSDDGSIHVWRVDVVSNFIGASASGGAPAETYYAEGEGSSVGRHGLSVVNTAVVRTIDTVNEGAVTNLAHFNGDCSSMIVYTTQFGGVHGWDLRCGQEAFHYRVRPELGSTVSMTVFQDRNALCVGTNEGVVQLWDVRYNIACRTWRHSSLSPIHRLASCKSIPRISAAKDIMPYTEGAYLFVAAGANEAAVWGVPEGGECLKCFRSIPMSAGRGLVAALPQLLDVNLPRHPCASFSLPTTVSSIGGGSLPFQTCGSNSSREPSVRAIMGRISQVGSSYLVTAGTDRQIKFWDFSSPTKCFTVAGLEPGQPKSTFEAFNGEDLYGKLFVGYDASLPSAETIVQAHVPHWQGRGPVAPSTSFKVGNRVYGF